MAESDQTSAKEPEVPEVLEVAGDTKTLEVSQASTGQGADTTSTTLNPDEAVYSVMGAELDAGSHAQAASAVDTAGTAGGIGPGPNARNHNNPPTPDRANQELSGFAEDEGAGPDEDGTFDSGSMFLGPSFPGENSEGDAGEDAEENAEENAEVVDDGSDSKRSASMSISDDSSVTVPTAEEENASKKRGRSSSSSELESGKRVRKD